MFIVGTTFSFKVFFQTLNSLFVVLFHCQKGKKAQQTFQGAAGSLPVFRRVYWIVKLFSQYCLQRASKQPKTSNLILSRSSNYIVDVVMRPNFDYSSIRGGSQFDSPLVIFQKMYLLKRGWNPGSLLLLILL